MVEVPRHPGPRFSLQTRRDAVAEMANITSASLRDRVARGLIKQAKASLMEDQIADVFGTFVWLIENEADIRAWLKVDKSDRALILARPNVAAEAVRAIEAEAAARAAEEVQL